MYVLCEGASDVLVIPPGVAAFEQSKSDRIESGSSTIEVTIMKINDVNRALQSVDSGPTSKASSPSAATKTTNASPAIGSIQISETSRSLQTAGASRTEAPFDAQRVSAIKSAIASGHFKVNPEAVADKVLNSASQLLTGKL